MCKRIVAVSILITTLACLTGCNSSADVQLAPTNTEAINIGASTEIAEVEKIYEDTVIQWTNPEIANNVRYMLGKEDGEEVTIREAAMITNLTLNKVKDSDLSDLKYLTSLEAICLRDTKLDDISLINNIPQLRKLEVYTEELTDLSPLKNNKMLENLTVETYGLEHLDDLSGMINLKKLSVSSDVLSDVSMIRELTGLEELYLESNTLQTLGIDFSDLVNLVNIAVRCNVLTDITCFSTLQSGVTINNGKVNVKFYNNETSVTEDSVNVIAQVRYNSLVFAGQCGYDEGFVDFNASVNGNVHERYRELIKQNGTPPVATIEEWMPESPAITIPSTWDDITIDFDGQLLTVPCSLQSLFDYGYKLVETGADLSNRLEAGRKAEYKLQKSNGAEIKIYITNTDDARAMAIEECPVTCIIISRSDFSEEHLPELFLPTDMEQRRLWDGPYANYISWNDGNKQLKKCSVGDDMERPATLTENVYATRLPNEFVISSFANNKKIYIYTNEFAINAIKLICE